MERKIHESKTVQNPLLVGVAFSGLISAAAVKQIRHAPKSSIDSHANRLDATNPRSVRVFPDASDRLASIVYLRNHAKQQNKTRRGLPTYCCCGRAWTKPWNPSLDRNYRSARRQPETHARTDLGAKTGQRLLWTSARSLKTDDWTDRSREPRTRSKHRAHVRDETTAENRPRYLQFIGWLPQRDPTTTHSPTCCSSVPCVSGV